MKLIYGNVGSMRHRTTIVMHLIIHICNSYRHCRILSVTKKLGDIWTDMLEIMKNEKYFENWCLFDYKFMANVSLMPLVWVVWVPRQQKWKIWHASSFI